ncbi:MAG: helix-turn-helix transcriptional regulator [Oscillospiraceae bacterium]|nr:helix-turn-helix transcriptional regulator [Oscillospiraceae bacterium]
MLKLTERAKALRKSKKLNQQKTAELCGISIMSYRRYESGEREPTATVLWKMADVFEVSVDYLIGRSDEP